MRPARIRALFRPALLFLALSPCLAAAVETVGESRRPFGDAMDIYVLAFTIGTPALAAFHLWKTRNLLRRHGELEVQAAEARRQAQESERRAEEARAAKTKFLSSMSHQIRTPMSGIIGMTDMLMHTRLSPEQREYADTIGNSGRVLLGIIDDILDLARAQDGEMTVERAPFDLRRAAEQAIVLSAPGAEQRQIDLAMRYAPGVPLGFFGDANRVRQVLLNLLSNGIKFTSQGYVLVEVTEESRAGDVLTVRVAVEDSGIGIDEKHRPRLFQEFEPLDPASRTSGAGLGLAIAKKLVELMGGRIGFQGNAGTGSTFWFTVPLHVAPDAGRKLPPALVETRARVLFAASKSLGRKVLAERLVELGLRVGEVEAPEDALTAMRQAHEIGAPFSVVILDLQRLGAEAQAIAEEIRQDTQLGRAGIVLLGSASVRAEGERLAQLVGGIYIAKPVRPSEFEDALAASLAGKAPDAGAIVPPLAVEATAPGRWSWDVLLVEDNAVNQRVAMAQLKSLGCRVELAANGCEAVEKVREHSYDIVFMDCLMPEMDGYEATRQIRQREGDARRTIIVAMTARVYAEDRQRCRDAGMDDYLAKPVLAEDMQRVLERWKPSGSEA